MSMMRADMSDIKRLEKDLKLFSRRAMPYASKFTLNTAARKAMFQWRDNMRDDLILRNQWTIKSTSFMQARSNEISSQRSVVGSRAEYMERTEEGGNVTNGGKAVPIATSYSAGQQGQQPRTRLPRRANARRNITLTKRGINAKNRKQRNIIAIKQAVKAGNKFVFLELERSKGLFRIVGTKRRPQIKMVHDMSRQSVRVPATPTLAPALDTINKEMPEIYKAALLFQLRRNKVFGY